MSWEGAKFEYKFLVFNIMNGPKNMIDNLGAEGEEGWCAYDSLVIDGDRVATFLRRQKSPPKVIEPAVEKEKTLRSLWKGSDEE